MKRPAVQVDLRQYYAGEERGHATKSLIVLHETVSHNSPGLGDITGPAAFLDGEGLEIHGIIDAEGHSGWCFDPTAVYDHAASGRGRVNTRGIGFELVSEIPLLPTNELREKAWLSDDRKLQLDTAARWCAWLHQTQGIPLRYSKADRPGITSHWNVSTTYSVPGGHWDCKPISEGGHFPLHYVIFKARELVAADL